MNNEFRPVNILRHPLWWAMLAVLVCNDWWWKYADWMPSAISGKLSDFAGMMIFPALMALVIGTGKKRWIGVHIAAAVIFSAVKLFPAAGGLYVDMMNIFGLQGEVWYDKTDLIALCFLPVSWAVYPRLRPVFALPKKSAALRAAAVIAAASACIASGGVSAPRSLTSYDGSLMVSDVVFINATNKEAAVQVEVLESNISRDCADIKPEYFIKDHFSSRGTWTQKPGEATTLISAAEVSKSNHNCQAVILTVNDIESVFIAWDIQKIQRKDTPVMYDLPITPANIPDDAIVLHRENNNYYLLSKGDFLMTYWNKGNYSFSNDD